MAASGSHAYEHQDGELCGLEDVAACEAERLGYPTCAATTDFSDGLEQVFTQ